MSRNVAASVRQRLLNLARQRGEDFQYLLIRYGLERLLFRLSQSDAANLFVLKGAALFALWTEQPHRATRDIDLLGRGDNSISQMEQVFRDIAVVKVEDDGVVFEPDTLRGEVIKRDEEYQGLRMNLTATLERARIPIQVDIGFGDVVTPEPTVADYPALLEFPAPRLATYSKESVVAEKFHAMVALGMGNSRMKDFFDLWVMGHEFSFDGEVLGRALEATFKRRRTPLPVEAPLALTGPFATDAVKQTQWRAFLGRISAQDRTPGLVAVCAFLETFLMPPAVVQQEETFVAVWPPGGPWSG